MVLLQHTCTIEVKEWVPSYEVMRTNFIKKKTNKTKQNKTTTTKKTNPICNFKIVELFIDMIVNSTVNTEQLNTLSWAPCMKLKTPSLRVHRLILVSFGAY